MNLPEEPSFSPPESSFGTEIGGKIKFKIRFYPFTGVTEELLLCRALRAALNPQFSYKLSIRLIIKIMKKQRHKVISTDSTIHANSIFTFFFTVVAIFLKLENITVGFL